MPAIDPKIMGAVLATVAALTFSGTGALDDLDSMNPGKIVEGFDSPFDIGSFFNSINQPPEPENKVEIEIRLKSFESRIKISQADLTANNFDELASDKRRIESSSYVKFSNFTGKIVMSNKTELKGSSEKISSNSLNITEEMKLRLNTDAEQIKAQNLNKMPLSLENVDANISSGSGTDITTENSPLKINSFNGEIIFRPKEELIVMNGFVDRVEAGTTIFSG